MIWKGRGSRVTSHSAVPPTYPPPVYEMSADRWGPQTKERKMTEEQSDETENQKEEETSKTNNKR